MLLRRRLSLPRRLLLLRVSCCCFSTAAFFSSSDSLANKDLNQLPIAANKPPSVLVCTGAAGATAFAGAACGAGVEGITTPFNIGSSRTGAEGDLDISNASGSGATTCS